MKTKCIHIIILIFILMYVFCGCNKTILIEKKSTKIDTETITVENNYTYYEEIVDDLEKQTISDNDYELIYTGETYSRGDYAIYGDYEIHVFFKKDEIYIINYTEKKHHIIIPEEIENLYVTAIEPIGFDSDMKIDEITLSKY